MDTSNYFEIETRAGGLIHVTASKFWSISILKCFQNRVAAEQEKVLRSGLRPRMLIDSRRHGVQSKEVVQGLQAIASSADGRVTKTAVVVGSALYRLQAARIGSGDLHAVFTDDREALDWLLADPRKPVFNTEIHAATD